MKKKKKTIHKKLRTLPKVSKSKSKKDTTKFPIDDVSYSKLVRFSTNQILFKIKDINKEYIESTRSISSVIGKAFHLALEVYYGGSDEYVVMHGDDAVRRGLEAGTDYLDKYEDGFVEFSSTIATKQDALEKFAFLYRSYITEQGSDNPNIKIVATEDEIVEHVKVEWNGKTVEFPIKLKGVLDKVYFEGKDLCIEDYKTTRAFSDPEKIDGAKMLQSVEYYFLAYAKYGVAPKKMVFTEVKMTQNRDGSPQTKRYEIVYSENELFFDFYFRFFADFIRALNGEQVYVPNIHAMFDNEVAIISYIHRLDDNEELAKKMKELKVDTITDVLKSEIHNATSMKVFMEAVQKTFTSYKTLNYDQMTLQDKIKTKLMEFGILVEFDSEIVGCSFTQYRFKPSIGVKMKKIESYEKDIEQVIGVSGIRILAPIPNTSLIGFEIPNKKRTFIKENPTPVGFELALGVDMNGEAVRSDIREAPHMLIAGATGSGKSVFVIKLVQQLLQLDNVEVTLLDPKIVELAKFAKNKKVTKYCTEPEDIEDTLAELVQEMNTRYKAMAKEGARNIEEYSKSLKYKFVVLDEYADVAKHGKISAYTLRLAQKARASGIHIILTTQRPSVDIISGTIKANFPTKVAFRMAKKVDSLVLLDDSGAEKLLGKGDMIFSDHNGSVRLQGFS